MEKGNESLDEWVQIQSEIVAIGNNSNSNQIPQSELSIFPPSNHEGLQVPSSDGSAVLESNEENDEKGLQPPQPKKLGRSEIIGKNFKLIRIEILRSWFVCMASRCHIRSGFWSFGSVTVILATAVLLYSRVQRWRQWRLWKKSEDGLILVLKEKDQKIRELLIQIAKMNETLSARARQKVPVIRVA